MLPSETRTLDVEILDGAESMLFRAFASKSISAGSSHGRPTLRALEDVHDQALALIARREEEISQLRCCLRERHARA
jgi:hypothetical protein